MKKFSFALLVSFALFACNDSSVEEKDSSLTVTDSSFKPVTPVTIADTLMSGTDSLQAQPLGQAGVNAPVQNISTPNATIPSPAIKPISPSTSAKGLNPAHGQPGHRCDIAVGAPLSSAPKTTAPTVTQSAPQVMTTSPATITPATSPVTLPKAAPGAKLNPPHGQPGHDCAVQVGAPLKG